MKKNQTKTTKILQALVNGESLTVASAMRKFKTHKLSARLSEFRLNLNLPIKSEWKKTKSSNFKVYSLGKISKEKRQVLNYYLRLKK